MMSAWEFDTVRSESAAGQTYCSTRFAGVSVTVYTEIGVHH